VCLCERNRCGDVGRRLGEHDRSRLLVHGQVPGEAGLVPLGVAGGDRIAVQQVPQRADARPGFTPCQDFGHA
jgi:hypothetical protein